METCGERRLPLEGRGGPKYVLVAVKRAAPAIPLVRNCPNEKWRPGGPKYVLVAVKRAAPPNIADAIFPI